MADTDTALGAPAERREGRDKVTGLARYAAEHTVSGRVHAWPVAAAIARGTGTARSTPARPCGSPESSPCSPTRTLPGSPTPTTPHSPSCRTPEYRTAVGR